MNLYVFYGLEILKTINTKKSNYETSMIGINKQGNDKKPLCPRLPKLTAGRFVPSW
jgi:hypothetical protein